MGLKPQYPGPTSRNSRIRIEMQGNVDGKMTEAIRLEINRLAQQNGLTVTHFEVTDAGAGTPGNRTK